MHDEVRHLGAILRRRFHLLDVTVRSIEPRRDRLHTDRGRMHSIRQPHAARREVAGHAHERAVALCVRAHDIRGNVFRQGECRVRPAAVGRFGEHEHFAFYIVGDRHEQPAVGRRDVLHRFARPRFKNRQRCEMRRIAHRRDDVEGRERATADCRGAARPRFRQPHHHLPTDEFSRR